MKKYDDDLEFGSLNEDSRDSRFIVPIIIVAVLLAIVIAALVLIGKNGKNKDTSADPMATEQSETTEAEAQTTEVMGTIEATESAEEADADDPQGSNMVGNETGASVDVTALLSAGSVAESGETTFGIDVARYQGTIDWAALKAQGVEYAVLTLKDAAGNIYYASQAAAAAGGIVAEPLDAGHIAAILREEKLIPVAQLAAFKDPISPRTDPSMAIHYNGSALWLDAQKNGNPWLNPYSTAAVEYVGDLVEEVQQLGFEQVVLTNVQFPKLSKKQDYGTTNGVSRADQLKADIAALQDRLSGKVTLWFSYTLDQCKNSSVALDVPALTLGVQNLLVTSDAAMDADALQALETAATDAGVENLTVHAADRFETDRVSG